MPEAFSPDTLSATFAALADPTRRAILARLATGETSVGELAAPFDISAPAVTKHLKVLERAGLITRSRQAQWRPCRLETKPLQDAAHWIEQYRQLWEARLDRLEDYLKQIQAETGSTETPTTVTATASVSPHSITQEKPRGRKKQ
ncbi:MAG TPA: metalloregulator ArsR/SmtB family transcription factor [Rhodocyclaceae bacterium]|jgi:DNA-binding transcriptional ArsR family regulator|nr:metalloregulator ArsR/SmtB family transcription factor [Rhodocyclaceae bacterium]